MLIKQFEHDQSTLKTLLKPVEDVYEEAISWIGSSDRKKANSAIKVVLAIPDLVLRLRVLSAKLCLHMRASHADNPVNAVAEYWRQWPMFKSLCRDCFSDQLKRKFDLMSQQGQRQTLTLDMFLKKFVLEEVSKRAPGTAESIGPDCRKNRYGPVLSIYWKDQRLAYHSFRWRINRFCHKFVCVCGERLTRGHVACCFRNDPDLWTLTEAVNPVDIALNTDDIDLFRRQVGKLSDLRIDQVEVMK